MQTTNLFLSVLEFAFLISLSLSPQSLPLSQPLAPIISKEAEATPTWFRRTTKKGIKIKSNQSRKERTRQIEAQTFLDMQKLSRIHEQRRRKKEARKQQETSSPPPVLQAHQGEVICNSASIEQQQQQLGVSVQWSVVQVQHSWSQ
ncbi:hypothetical protein [Oryza sativa Japonica Group]|uniref:Uncharacterized protein n=1 Tax=Oryza sativa subsp. japonica TaxID=39947 RepID=Q5JK36_ORYSJ|nr:hypothetical protein [Oryza sativa Japonica Group]